ncbi:MAG TPA: hypothetical protein VNZ85_16865 [Caulobacter sp.]|nr:hypothetical protein [Caulobacter sp.]
MSARRAVGRWLSCVATAALLATGSAKAQAPVINPPPTRADWAALAKLPDWTGVWIPPVFAPQKTPPSWKPEIAAQVAELQAEEKAGRPRNIYVNCLPEGMPSWAIMNLSTVEFLFTPGRITILSEFDGNRTRRIYTDGRGHPDDPDLTFNGHSIGWWEGDTLVVDTVGILPQTFLPLGQGVGIPNNGDTHIVERIRLSEPDTLRIDLVIEAPKVLTAPWKISREFKRNRERARDILEASCRQGDFIDDVDVKGNAIFTPIPHDEGGAPLPPDSPPNPSRPAAG